MPAIVKRAGAVLVLLTGLLGGCVAPYDAGYGAGYGETWAPAPAPGGYVDGYWYDDGYHDGGYYDGGPYAGHSGGYVGGSVGVIVGGRSHAPGYYGSRGYGRGHGYRAPGRAYRSHGQPQRQYRPDGRAHRPDRDDRDDYRGNYRGDNRGGGYRPGAGGQPPRDARPGVERRALERRAAEVGRDPGTVQRRGRYQTVPDARAGYGGRDVRRAQGTAPRTGRPDSGGRTGQRPGGGRGVAEDARGGRPDARATRQARPDGRAPQQSRPDRREAAVQRDTGRTRGDSSGRAAYTRPTDEEIRRRDGSSGSGRSGGDIRARDYPQRQGRQVGG